MICQIKFSRENRFNLQKKHIRGIVTHQTDTLRQKEKSWRFRLQSSDAEGWLSKQEHTPVKSMIDRQRESNDPQKPIGYIDLIRQNPNFRWLWCGQVVSLLGDWFNLIASAILIADLTGSGLAIGVLFTIRMFAPFFCCATCGDLC